MQRLQDGQRLQVAVAECAPIDAKGGRGRIVDGQDRVGRDHEAKWHVVRISGKAVDDFERVDGGGDGDGVVPQLPKNSELQITVAFAFAATLPIPRHSNRSRHDSVKLRQIVQIHRLSPRVHVR